MRERHGPAFRVPPPAIFITVFLVALWLEAAVYRVWLVPDVRTPAALVASGVALVVLGVAIAVAGVLAFLRSRTTIMPYKRASSMVVAGPYRFTRNPMYVGMALAHVGGALALNAGWPLLLLPVAMVLLHVLVIRGEERLMAETFGAEYDAYRTRVRRWL